jgi:hypothetical protein
MLRTVSELEGYTIGATDDTVGQVSDLYFDDRVWTLRYFIVETSGGAPLYDGDATRPGRGSKHLQALRAQRLLVRAQFAALKSPERL